MSVNTTDKVYYAYTPYIELLHSNAFGWPRERATVALKKIGNEMHYGISVCSAKDQFVRKVGREMAEQRLEEGFGMFTLTRGVIDRFKDDHELCLYFLNNMVNNVWKDMGKVQHKIGNKKTPKQLEYKPDLVQYVED